MKDDTKLVTVRARMSLDRRDKETAQELASEIDGLGFKKIHIAPRGISFEGTIEHFENVFQSPISTSETGYQFDKKPVIPLPENIHVRTFYFPTKPEFFNKKRVTGYGHVKRPGAHGTQKQGR